MFSEKVNSKFSKKTHFVEHPCGKWGCQMAINTHRPAPTPPHIPIRLQARLSNNPKIQLPGRNNLIKHYAAIPIGDTKKPPFITINTGARSRAYSLSLPLARSTTSLH